MAIHYPPQREKRPPPPRYQYQTPLDTGSPIPYNDQMEPALQHLHNWNHIKTPLNTNHPGMRPLVRHRIEHRINCDCGVYLEIGIPHGRSPTDQVQLGKDLIAVYNFLAPRH